MDDNTNTYEGCKFDTVVLNHPDGANLIKQERSRQVTLGYDIDHDDRHKNGELAMAACCYACTQPIYKRWHDLENESFTFSDPWPFSLSDDKRRKCGLYIGTPDGYNAKGRIEFLVKAGALIAAEIDRLYRIIDGENLE